MFERFSAMGVAVSFSVLVAGCGGSGSDPANVPGHLANVTVEDRKGLSDALRNAAVDPGRLTPRQIDPDSSSVVQSSSGAGEVSVTVDYDKGLKYTVTSVNPEWEITPDNADSSRDMPVYPGKELTKKVAGGTVYVDVYTDYVKPEEGGDTDYLAGGVWLFVPEDSSGTYSLGAFASGNSKFDGSNPGPGTLGKARYAGNARGTYLAQSGKIGYLDGGVSLTANFDANNISGEITNIRKDSPTPNTVGSLKLGEAEITSRFELFKGSLSGTVDGTDYTGDWGGQFFGSRVLDKDEEDERNYPGSVGGTFTAIPDDNGEGASFLGMIRAYFQNEIKDTS